MTYFYREFINNEIYHIVSRAIDDKLLFIDLDDYLGAFFSIYEFNNLKSVSIVKR